MIAGIRLGYDKEAKDFKSAVTVWDAQKGEVRLSLGEETMTLASIAFSPDGKHLAVAAIRSAPGNRRVWSVRLLDSETGATKKTIPLQGTVRKVVFSPDGQDAGHRRAGFSAIDHWSIPRTVLLWDLKQDKAINVFRQELRVDDIQKSGQLDGLWDLVFSPDGRLWPAADVDFECD